MYGTSMHYPGCQDRQCSGCIPPDPAPEPVRTPAPDGMPPEKWAVMNRRERRAVTKGRKR